MNFITIHETGNTRAGANARAHGSFLQNPNTQVSWHYTTDDTETVQHLPENEDAFHAGDGSGNGNRQSIGIEICVNSDGDFKKAVKRTAVLVADICKRRNIPVENIRQHFSWSNKNCPENIRARRPISWGVFLDEVRLAMQDRRPMGVNVAIGGLMLHVPSAMNIDGRWVVMLPNGPEGQPQPNVLLRVMLEALGLDVGWDEAANTITTTRPISADELRLLNTIVHWEARGEDLTGQIMVANVVLNRLACQTFPNTINDVIFAPGAFSPTQRPDFDNAQPSRRTLDAVQQALSGTDYSDGATYFHAINHLTPDVWHERAVRDGMLVHVKDHGNHRFYKRA